MATVTNEVGSFVYDICQAKDFGNGVIVEQYGNEYTVYYPYYSGGHDVMDKYSGNHCLYLSATHLNNHIYRHRVEPKIGDEVLVIDGVQTGIVGIIKEMTYIFVIFEDGEYVRKSQVVVLPPKLREGDTIEDNFKPKALWKSEWRPHPSPYFKRAKDEIDELALRTYDELCSTPNIENIRIKMDELVEASFDHGFTYLYGVRFLSSSNSKKESFMSRLRDIPNRIKRLLNKGEQAMYELGWINCDLDVADNGIDAMNDFLFEKFREELGAEAIKQTADIKKKEAEVKKQA